MLIMAKSSLAFLISFFIAILLGSFLVPLLRKFKIKQVLNIYLLNDHKSKKETPTMGGLIFIISTLITMLILLLMNKISFSYLIPNF